MPVYEAHLLSPSSWRRLPKGTGPAEIILRNTPHNVRDRDLGEQVCVGDVPPNLSML